MSLLTDQQLADMVARNAAFFAAYQTWSAGQVMLLAGSKDDPASFNKDGGKVPPLGFYPVVNVNGQTMYVPCIERLSVVQSLPPLPPTHGIAAGGETTIPAPGPIPADSPWWVTVFWNGVAQRAGVDFTTDGSSTVKLNFSANAGDDWIVEQRHRSAS